MLSVHPVPYPKETRLGLYLTFCPTLSCSFISTPCCVGLWAFFPIKGANLITSWCLKGKFKSNHLFLAEQFLLSKMLSPELRPDEWDVARCCADFCSFHWPLIIVIGENPHIINPRILFWLDSNHTRMTLQVLQIFVVLSYASPFFPNQQFSHAVQVSFMWVSILNVHSHWECCYFWWQ